MEYVKIFLALVFVVLIVIFTLWRYRRYRDMKRCMEMVFLKLSFPIKDSKDDKEKEAESVWGQTVTHKDVLDVMAHFFESMYSIYGWNLINKFIWEEFFSVEMAIVNKELYFYTVIPRKLKILFEKQVSAFYPDIFIDEEHWYNIFEKWSFTASRVYVFGADNHQPIKTYDRMWSDPINTIINAMSKMEENEWAAVQIVLRPAKDWWQKKWREHAKDILAWKDWGDKWFFHYINPFTYLSFIAKALISDWEMPSDDNDWWRTSQVTEEIVKVMEEKNTHIWFESVIRVITSAPTQEKADTQRNIIASAFAQYAEPDTNSFSMLMRYSHKSAIYNYIARNLDIDWLAYAWTWKYWNILRKPMIMTPKEITSVIHYPNIKYNRSVVIKWQEFKIAPAPSNLPSEWVLLWINSFRWTEREIKIKKNDRMRHFYLIWKSGTWKSSLLETMIKQDFENWDWVCVVDPHGDLIEAVLPHVPRHRADDVIVFDPWDLERPMWLNILEAYGEDEKEFVAQETLAIFIKLFWEEIMWPRLQHYFRNGVLTLMADDKEWASLIDIPRLFTDDAYMQHKSAKVTNPEVRSFWDNEMAKTGQREKEEMIPYFSSKFWPFKTNAQIRNIIGQTKSWFNFRRVMDDKKILLVNLSKGKLWDLNSKLLWMVIVAKIQMAAMSRVDIPEAQRSDFYLYVDEFQNFVTDSFASILSEARKYRLGLIIAHQYISQITKMNVWGKWSQEDTTIRDAVFWNVWSMMCFKIWAADWETMSKEFQPVFSEQDLINIANYNAYIKLNIDNTTSRGFSMRTIYDKSWADYDAANAYKQLSRLKHARERGFVEQEIMRRISG